MEKKVYFSTSQEAGEKEILADNSQLTLLNFDRYKNEQRVINLLNEVKSGHDTSKTALLFKQFADNTFLIFEKSDFELGDNGFIAFNVFHYNYGIVKVLTIKQ